MPAASRTRSRGDHAVGETAGETQHLRLKGAEQDRGPLDITEVEATDHRQPLPAHLGWLAAEQGEQRLEVLAHELDRALIGQAEPALHDVRVGHADAEG